MGRGRKEWEDEDRSLRKNDYPDVLEAK